MTGVDTFEAFDRRSPAVGEAEPATPVRDERDNSDHARVVIVGGGTAGTAAAAALRRRLPRHARILLIEPNTTHHYQPGFTLVGGGVWSLQRTRRRQAALVPAGVEWLRERATGFLPERNAVRLGDGRSIGYDFLIACPGLELQWGRIPGLAEALGDGRVCSIYEGEAAAGTWNRIRDLAGGKALFTQPPMPIKCPGAPQKIVYLAADHWRRRGVRDAIRLRFRTATPSLFSVPEYTPTLERVAAGHGVDVGYGARLVAVDGPAANATFERTAADGTTERWDEDYDLLHAVPPQGPPAVVRDSELADEAGWVDVDPASLQHRRYANVFGIGDAASVPTSKTAAAVRAQLPVLVDNLVAAMAGQAPVTAYSGYASCPLITRYGRVVLAEFVYERKLAPSLPWDSTREHRFAWWLKTRLLPWMYWQRLLKGRDLPVVARH